MTTVLYVALIAIGVFGLVMTGAFPTQGTIVSLQSLNATQTELIAALERKAAAFEHLNEALDRKAAAAENLAAEREKALVLYRQLVPPSFLPAETFGIPAERLGGGKGN